MVACVGIMMASLYAMNDTYFATKITYTMLRAEGGLVQAWLDNFFIMRDRPDVFHLLHVLGRNAEEAE